MNTQTHAHHGNGNILVTSAQATLHCLTGCVIGEVAGLMIGIAVAIPAGFLAAWPVNWWLLKRNLKACH